MKAVGAMRAELPENAIIPGLDMPVLEAYALARQASMFLITDGFHIIISPHIMPGWREVPIRIKQAANTTEAMPCAA